MATAFIDQAKQGEELRPGPIAQIHRIRVPTHILPQPLEESGDRVVVGVDRITRQQSPVFGIQDEHQPHEHGQEASIHMVGIGGQRLM